MKNWFGIDFGTTNSSAAGIVDTGVGTEIIRYGDDFGGPFPSVVAIDRNTGEVYHGRRAWEKKRELTEHCEVISSVKNWLGTEKTWMIAGETWTPEKVAAEILNGLKHQISSRHGFEITEAMVSVPVGFTLEKRRALKEAARKASIDVKGFVSESTSAFFRNYKHVSHCMKSVVFDWGGGTLDISVILNKGGKVYELATSGLKLGGDDIDVKFAQWLHNKIIKDKQVKKSFEEMLPKYQDMLLVKAERAKRELSEADSTLVTMNNYGEYGVVRANVDIDAFTLLIEPEVDSAIECLEKTVKEAGMSMQEIESVIMAGGSSNLRPLLDKIDSRWGDKVFYPEDSVWNVAEGAALLSKSPGSTKLNQDIGLLMSDDTFYPLFKKGDSIQSCRIGPLHFGVVDDARNAVFSFSDRTKVIDYVNVPVYGFYDELVEFKAQIDEYMVFASEMKSSHKPGDAPKYIEYPGLTFYYELPTI